MTKSERRLRVRIRRVKRRLARTETRLEALEQLDALQLRGKLGEWVARSLENEDSFLADADTDADGKVDFEELVDALRDEADEMIEAGELAELISDLGLDAIAYVAVAIYKGTENRLSKRLERRKRVLARLETRLSRMSR